jgi:hypothetical protein
VVMGEARRSDVIPRIRVIALEPTVMAVVEIGDIEPAPSRRYLSLADLVHSLPIYTSACILAFHVLRIPSELPERNRRVYGDHATVQRQRARWVISDYSDHCLYRQSLDVKNRMMTRWVVSHLCQKTGEA